MQPGPLWRRACLVSYHRTRAHAHALAQAYFMAGATITHHLVWFSSSTLLDVNALAFTDATIGENMCVRRRRGPGVLRGPDILR